MSGPKPVADDADRSARADYLALLNEVGMIPGSWRPGATPAERWAASRLTSEEVGN